MESWQALLFGATLGLGFWLRAAGKELEKKNCKEKERGTYRMLGTFFVAVAVVFLLLFSLILPVVNVL